MLFDKSSDIFLIEIFIGTIIAPIYLILLLCVNVKYFNISKFIFAVRHGDIIDYSIFIKPSIGEKSGVLEPSPICV